MSYRDIVEIMFIAAFLFVVCFGIVAISFPTFGTRSDWRIKRLKNRIEELELREKLLKLEGREAESRR